MDLEKIPLGTTKQSNIINIIKQENKITNKIREISSWNAENEEQTIEIIT